MTESNESVGLDALNRIASAALDLAQLESLSVWNKLSVLMDLENVLDKGRGYAAGRNSEAQEETYRELVANMDKLRSIIRERLDAQDQEEAASFMQQRGRDAMNQFTLARNAEL